MTAPVPNKARQHFSRERCSVLFHIWPASQMCVPSVAQPSKMFNPFLSSLSPVSTDWFFSPVTSCSLSHSVICSWKLPSLTLWQYWIQYKVVNGIRVGKWLWVSFDLLSSLKDVEKSRLASTVRTHQTCCDWYQAKVFFFLSMEAWFNYECECGQRSRWFTSCDAQAGHDSGNSNIITSSRCHVFNKRHSSLPW